MGRNSCPSKSSLVSPEPLKQLGEVRDHPKSCEVEKSTQSSCFDVGIWNDS